MSFLRKLFRKPIVEYNIRILFFEKNEENFKTLPVITIEDVSLGSAAHGAAEIHGIDPGSVSYCYLGKDKKGIDEYELMRIF